MEDTEWSFYRGHGLARFLQLSFPDNVLSFLLLFFLSFRCFITFHVSKLLQTGRRSRYINRRPLVPLRTKGSRSKLRLLKRVIFM